MKQKPLKMSPAQHAHLVNRLQVAVARRGSKLKESSRWDDNKLPRAARALRRQARQLEKRKDRLDTRIEKIVNGINEKVQARRQKIIDEATQIRELLLFGDPSQGLAAVKRFEQTK